MQWMDAERNITAQEDIVYSFYSSPVIPKLKPRPNKEIAKLEHQSSTLGLLIATAESQHPSTPHHKRQHIPQLKVLAALQRQLLLGLAGGALETQHDLLGRLGLLVEDGLGLTTITALLSVVTALTLGIQRGLVQ